MSNTLNGEIPEEIGMKIEAEADKEEIYPDKRKDNYAGHETKMLYEINDERSSCFIKGAEYSYRLALDQIAALQQENERLKKRAAHLEKEFEAANKEIIYLQSQLSSLKEQGDGWISVETQPEIDTLVILGWAERIGVSFGHLRTGKDYNETGNVFCAHDGMFIFQPSHWRALPQPPKS